LFLWTPPHFWALAFACKRDYAAAGVPMLPVIVSDKVSTLSILAHVLVLVPLSLLPFWYGMGWIYLSSAILGGVIFIYTSLRMHTSPDISNAWKTFAGSIVQLGLLLIGAVIDTLVLG
jgi:protoheme IX farnesyltransferase